MEKAARSNVKVALIDDHVLLRSSLAIVIDQYLGYPVIFQANNGEHFIELLDPKDPPGIVILDVNMPKMNGYETALWITKNHPQIRVIALSMQSDEHSVIRMLRCGAKGYLLKDTEPEDMKKALDDVSGKGIYINDILYRNIIHSINSSEGVEETERAVLSTMTERECEFLRWVATDKSYKEIAAIMFLSPRTVDGYRDILFDKLKVNSRVGLVLFAIRNNIIRV